MMGLGVLALVGALVWAPTPLPDADAPGDAPPGIVLTHDWYAPWMQPHRPLFSCCNEQDCAPVDARWNEKEGLWEALIDGRWQLIPKHIVLDPKKAESPGGFHACWNRNTGELLCFREGEVR